MTMSQRKEVMVEWLSEEFPPPGPVRVRLVRYIAPIPEGDTPLSADMRTRGDFGECWSDRGRYYIDISLARVTTHDALIDTILHEWAHLLAVKGGKLERHRRSHHDAEWGISFARVYRGYIEDGGYETVRQMARTRWA
jgi:hypothetical protein